MSATSWLIVAIVGFSLSGAGLIASIILFVKLNVPGIIGDLTGKTVAREIKARKDAKAAGSKTNGPGSVQKVSGVQMDRSAIAAAHASKRLDRASTAGPSSQLTSSKALRRSAGSVSSPRKNTENAAAEKRGATAVLSQNYVPEANTYPSGVPMQPDGAADRDETGQTELLSQDCETQILSDAYDAQPDIGGETTVLSAPEEIHREELKPVAFRVTRSVIKIHTDEVI